MGNRILYTILFCWTKAHAFLPMRILYILSDILYLLVYRLVRYRLKVVRRNMKASFPEKTEKELRQLERAFYHHFSDYIVETIKLAHISPKEALKRAIIRNPEMIEELQKRGHYCFILLMGHYGNWEWFTDSPLLFDRIQTEVHQVYRPLKNRAFDRLFIYLRTRFHAKGIMKNEAFRDIVRLKQSKTRSIVVFIADQTPSKANLHYWTRFLNQDTPILNGPERIACKLRLPVIYADVRKVRRGYYTVDFNLLTDSPEKMPENWITEQFARRMEETILRDPAYWLWTHKRWKYKHEQP
ncbi:lysophospholipid acyltransferase family protein [Parabacteroides sp. Marseille-P3160]|uniref:lysophospholipid acyltransferase family protein n=1 Tax=Parabacteroides sp. Marseille-P3160 TaxID=1917887 RepID=UPI0009BB3595|nr:lysophospholipid acyltransferase family protein [Parabacteroides sp. Marseille-P3160]